MKHNIAITCLVTPFAFAAVDEPINQEANAMEELIVSALRTPQPAPSVTSFVTVLDAGKSVERGIYQLQDLLNLSPGVIATSTAGQTGAVGSLFIRGTRTDQSLLVVDGMRLSDSGTPLGNLFAAGRTWDLGRVEMLRGPQGALYGGESIGGVLWLETPRGFGNPSGSATMEGGSFGSFAGFATFQGESNGLSYYLGGGYEQTQNDGRNLDFHQGSIALRAEAAINGVWSIGTTFRAVDGYYENGGASDERFDGALATIYGIGRISDVWTARFLAGYHQNFYDSDSSFGNYGTDLRTLTFSTDHEFRVAENLRILAGAYVTENSYENTIGTDKSRTRHGVSGAFEWTPFESLTTTGALRWEDYGEYGDELTWRMGTARTWEKTGTTLRGGIGSSFRAPTYTDLFGSSFGAGNPDLKAESSLGWDIGISQTIIRNHQLELTWFQNRISDAIQSFPAPPVNLSGSTDTNGLEVALDGSWENSAVHYRLAWTYLHECLMDQPRNAVTGVMDWRPSEKFLIGVGATHLSARSWGGDPISSYTVARIFAAYDLTEQVKLHARVENLFGENYRLSDFFGTVQEGAGTGVHAGITVSW